MKRTNQMRTGNVTGTGKKFRGPRAQHLNVPARQISKRKAKPAAHSLPVGMSLLLSALFVRAGLPTPY